MAWEYKITKSSLWYKIYRKKEEDWIMKMEWLQRNSYTLNIENARTFYTVNDAMSALVIAKTQWDKRSLEKKQTPITSTKKSGLEGKREKKSWSEL